MSWMQHVPPKAPLMSDCAVLYLTEKVRDDKEKRLLEEKEKIKREGKMEMKEEKNKKKCIG